MVSVKCLQGVESQVKGDTTPESVGSATMSLVYLNANLSKLRTTLQDLHASVAVLKLNTPELETPCH